MLTVKKQMFFDNFLMGFWYVLMGIGRLMDRSRFKELSYILTYSSIVLFILIILQYRKRYQRDDELSKLNKQNAESKMYRLLFISVALHAISLDSFPIIRQFFPLDTSTILIHFGLSQMCYYLLFCKLEKED